MIVGVDVVLQFYTQYMMIFAEIEQDDRTENEIQRSLNDWLVVSNIFSIIYGEQSFPTDELICFKMDFQWDFRDWTVVNTCCCFFCLIFIVTKKVYWLILSIIYIYIIYRERFMVFMEFNGFSFILIVTELYINQLVSGMIIQCFC